MVECKNQGGRLPNASELAKIAKAIYNDNSISESEDYNYNSPTANEWDKSVTAKLGIEDSASWFCLFTQFENDKYTVASRCFSNLHTDYTTGCYRGDFQYNDDRAICVAD